MFSIHVKGENEVEVAQISREIGLVIDDRVVEIGRHKDRDETEATYLREQLKIISNRTYCWVALILLLLNRTLDFTKNIVRKAIDSIAHTVDAAQDKVLEEFRAPNKQSRLKCFCT